MGLESGTYISSLNAANPTGGDPRNEGDNHLRLIKSTLVASFPNIKGSASCSHLDLQSLADGSGTFAPGGFWTNTLGAVRRGIDGFVTASMRLTANNVAAVTTSIAILPVAYRPLADLYVPGYYFIAASTTYVPCLLKVASATGVVSLMGASSVLAAVAVSDEVRVSFAFASR